MAKKKAKKKVAKKVEPSGARQQELPDTPWGHRQRERLAATGPAKDAAASNEDTE